MSSHSKVNASISNTGIRIAHTIQDGEFTYVRSYTSIVCASIRVCVYSVHVQVACGWCLLLMHKYCVWVLYVHVHVIEVVLFVLYVGVY